MAFTRFRPLRCPAKLPRPCRSLNLAVTAYRENFSHFEVGHHASSDYSEIACLECGNRWRTKSKDVERILERQPNRQPLNRAQLTQAAAALRDKKDLHISARRSPGGDNSAPRGQAVRS